MQPSINWDFKIGTVSLYRFEVPEEFTIGFEQNIAVHKFLAEDGTPNIVTHSLGVYPVPTKWKGTFYYSGALTRYQTLEALATQTSPVTWQYGPLSYLVQVKSVVGTVKHQLEIDYEIELIVLQSSNKIQPSSAIDITTSTNATAAFSAGSTNYTSLSTATTLPVTVTQTYQTMSTLLGQLTPLSGASYSQILALSQAIAAFNAAMDLYLVAAKNQSLTENTTNLLILGLQTYSNFTAFGNYIDTLVGSNSTEATTVSVPAGTSMFSLSSQFYPQIPPDQGATLIAQANGINDLFTSSSMQLTIPPQTA